MKALTLHQPWASLIAEGVKTIETRSWSTKYRGPMAIHAAKTAEWEQVAVGPWRLHAQFTDVPEIRRFGAIHNGELVPDRCERRLAFSAPLGAIVATATLIDVVPIEVVLPGVDRPRSQSAYSSGYDKVTAHPLTNEVYRWAGNNGYDIYDQRSFGDFSPGRYAWLLADVVKLPHPISCRGHQGLWEWAE